MVIAIFGESCTGKSTLAAALKTRLGAAVYTGKDYLRMAKSEAEAERLFRELLATATEPVVYVISEREHLALLPENCLRVLVTAELETIQARFAKRTGGVLPPPLKKRLEARHGEFDGEAHDFHVDGNSDTQIICDAICKRVEM